MESEKPAAAKKRKRLDVMEASIDACFDRPQVELPSHARLTEKGGYTHTTSSRYKIGAANKGNVPWNKGKNRSEESKAKIGMAVRARNQALLAANLKKLGLATEDYEKSKLEVKYMRERLRKIRLANAERIEKEKKEREVLENYFKYGCANYHDESVSEPNGTSVPQPSIGTRRSSDETSIGCC